jgi:hypothetical protein
MRDLVVRIRSAAGGWGTGFVVAPGRVATALHVVAQRKADPPVFFPGLQVEAARLAPDGRAWQRASAPATVVQGAWDRGQDWAVLAFEEAALGFSPPALPLRELAPDEARGQGWESYGFPEAYPEDGAPATGHVQSAAAAQDGLRALALFSHEAAAGSGMPVRGFSGAPVLVGGQVVGILRFALTNQELSGVGLRRSEGGTLYATPISAVAEALGLPLAAGGLPPLAVDAPLPAEPFRYLARYEAGDARIFFGRARPVQRLLAALARPAAPAVTLLYGAAGVGKSSFLRAGVLPRRPPGSVALEARGPEGLAATWARLVGAALPEQGALRILDQVEEAWTRGGGREEVQAFLTDLSAWLATQPPGPQVILAFRKDWLPEVEDALAAHGLRAGQMFLEPLDRAGVLDTMEGFVRDPEVQAHFRIALEPGLAERVAAHLLADFEGALTPVLQVTLTQLWARAAARAQAAGDPVRRLTVADWQAELRSGLGLRAFVERQLASLAPAHARAVESGLALELLSLHTTPAGTAARVDDDALAAAFERPGPALALARALEGQWLLVGEGPNARRLAHDTLVPVLRELEATSTRPAQNARRILAVLAPSGREDEEAGLSLRQLRVVARARPWMRRPSEAEARLIETSRRQNRLARRLAGRAGQALVFLPILLLALALPLWAVEGSDRLHLWWVERDLAQLLDGPEVQPPPSEVRDRLPIDVLARWRALGLYDERRLLRAEWLYQAGLGGAPVALPEWSVGSPFEVAAWLDGRGASGAPAIQPAVERASDPLVKLVWAEAAGAPVDGLMAEAWDKELLLQLLPDGALQAALQSHPSLLPDGPGFQRLAPARPDLAMAHLAQADVWSAGAVALVLEGGPAPGLMDELQRRLDPGQDADAHQARLLLAVARGDYARAYAEAAGVEAPLTGRAEQRQARAWAAAMARLARHLPEDRAPAPAGMQPVLHWMAHAEGRGPRPAPPPPHFRELTLAMVGFDPAVGPLQDDARQQGGDALRAAAALAQRLGMAGPARSLATELARRYCAEGDYRAQVGLELLLAAGAFEEAQACLRSAPALSGLQALACPARLLMGEPEAAARCVAERRVVESPKRSLAFASALLRHGQEAAALATVEAVDTPPMPLAMAWLEDTVDAETCAAATATALLHARRGAARQAHLHARRCAYPWVRLYVGLELVAALRGTGLWTPQHLARRLHRPPDEPLERDSDAYAFDLP